RPPRTLTHLHLVSGAVGIAASDACNEVAGFRPRLKWPNDVVMPGLSGRERVDDKKLGGILAEVVDRAVVVGIGLNVNWPSPLPPELAGIATAANLVAGPEVGRAAMFVPLPVT